MIEGTQKAALERQLPGDRELNQSRERIVTVSSRQPSTFRQSSPGQEQHTSVVTEFRNKRNADEEAEARLSPDDLQLLAEQVERLKQHLDELPEVDATRVIQIYNRIQAGSYQVDADRLAEKLTAMESALDKP